MDPLANLNEQLELARALVAELDGGDGADVIEYAERLAELVLALDEWRRKGGYDPYNSIYAATQGQQG